MGPVSSPHTAANATKRNQHQAPRRGKQNYQHQAPRRGQQNYAHELPQSDDSHMRLRLLGEMYTKLYDEACAKHNEAYVIGVAYSNLQTQILGANYTRPLNAQRPMNSCSQASPKLGGKDEREETPLSYFDKAANHGDVFHTTELPLSSKSGEVGIISPCNSSLTRIVKEKNKDAVKDLPSIDSTSEPVMNFRYNRRGCRGAKSKLHVKNQAKYVYCK